MFGAVRGRIRVWSSEFGLGLEAFLRPLHKGSRMLLHTSKFDQRQIHGLFFL